MEGRKISRTEMELPPIIRKILFIGMYVSLHILQVSCSLKKLACVAVRKNLRNRGQGYCIKY